jgi:hypothetical protein
MRRRGCVLRTPQGFCRALRLRDHPMRIAGAGQLVRLSTTAHTLDLTIAQDGVDGRWCLFVVGESPTGTSAASLRFTWINVAHPRVRIRRHGSGWS